MDESIRIIQHNYDTTVIQSGDFNMEYFQMSWEKQFLCDVLETYNLHVTLVTPTRITEDSSTQIDYIISNMDNESYYEKGLRK